VLVRRVGVAGFLDLAPRSLPLALLVGVLTDCVFFAERLEAGEIRVRLILRDLGEDLEGLAAPATLVDQHPAALVPLPEVIYGRVPHHQLIFGVPADVDLRGRDAVDLVDLQARHLVVDHDQPVFDLAVGVDERVSRPGRQVLRSPIPVTPAQRAIVGSRRVVELLDHAIAGTRATWTGDHTTEQ
jgi:hypothetical protein